MTVEAEDKTIIQRKQQCAYSVLTGDLGKISASNFLYLLTGCRDRDLKAGQQTHMFPHAGNIF